MQRLARKNYRQDRGFALLVTIVLVAFLVLILVGLATFTRVETQVASNAQQLALARQNALAGLNVALGQLQRHAGPDRRATARADLAAGVANPYYVGVWDSTVAGATATNPAAWLVSGNEVNGVANTPAIDISANANAVLLVDKAVNSQAALRVRALKQPISSTSAPGISGSVPIGNFAYWVGDESMKARANMVSPWPKPASAGAVRDQEAGYNFASAQRTGVEQVAREVSPPVAAGTAIGTAAYVPNSVDLSKVLSKEQLPFALPSALAAAEKTAVTDAYKHRFHDVTTESVSLLTDTRQGGLKQDLTRLLESGAAAAYPAVAAANTAPLFGALGGGNYYENPPTWGLLRSFANSTSNGAAIGPRLPDATTQGIAPVLLWSEVGYALGLNATSTNLRMHYFPRILLWNPYNVPLASGEFEVGFLGNRFHTLTITPSGGSGGPVYYNMGGNTFTAAPTSAINFLRFRLTSGVIPAGNTVLYTLQTPGIYNSNGDNRLVAADNVGSVYIEDTLVPIVVGGPLSITYPAGGGEMHTYLREWVNSQAALASLAPTANTYQYIGRVGAEQTPAIVTINSTATGIAAEFRGLARARLGAVNAALPMRWVANGNIRAPYINRSHVSADISNYNPLYNGFITSSGTPSTGAAVHVNRLFDATGTSADDLVLFQVPRADTPLFSIADLRHANLGLVGTSPAYPIATSLADFRVFSSAAVVGRSITSLLPAAGAPDGAVNYRLYDHAYLLNQALWDRYFFSTVPAGLTVANVADPTYALPNGRLSFLRRNNAVPAAPDLLDPALASKNLVLKGGFNINSTSVQAWRAQLSSLNALAYNPVAGTDGGAAMDYPFSRFNRPVATSTNAWQGFRQLTAGQINTLAEAIVAEVRSRGPFLSVGQFVNRALAPVAVTGLKGPLQAAIDAVDIAAVAPINNSVPWTQDAAAAPVTTGGYDLDALRGLNGGAATLPVASRNAGGPGNLTQADILAALGSSLTARGDTFLVRTYGDVQNPATGAIEGRAWCEAVVQRLPDYVNATADAAELFPPTNADNVLFGRKFQVVSFRWLSPEDI